LTGSPGPDWLEGRQGADVLTGRQGNDIFSFRFGDSSRNAPDRITDFQRGDRIRLTGFPTRTVLRGSTIREPPSAIFGAAFRDADATRAGLQPLRANQATLLTSNWQGRQTNWLVVNDGNHVKSDRDFLIQITGQLPQLNQILI
jgi:Ca2+-binding RTX toxin-like protein